MVRPAGAPGRGSRRGGDHGARRRPPTGGGVDRLTTPEQGHLENCRHVRLGQVVVRAEWRLGHGTTLAVDPRTAWTADATRPQNGQVTRLPNRRVLLTGGIGSGKSTVGRLLAEWGAYVVDADDLAREVVAPGTVGHAAVLREFGPGILGATGALDRAALAEVVFGDPERLMALEAIVHPLVRQAAEARFALAPPGVVKVYEIPVLRQREPGDWVLLVEAPVEVRRARLLERGLGDDQVAARMAQQPDTEGWRALADRVISNDRDLGALVDETRRAWLEITGEESPGSDREDAVGAAD